MLKIAIDYDDTYTEATELFSLFIHAAKTLGNECKFVTFRSAEGFNLDIEFDAQKLGIGIIYTGGYQKESRYPADIWIDDSPVTIPSYEKLISMSKGCEVFDETQK